MKDIDEARVLKAMEYLADTDSAYAVEKATVERTEILRKRSRARVFLTTEGTVAERQAQAETHADVAAADDEYITAVKAYEELRARRQRAELLVDVFRTLESSRRVAMR